MNMFIDKILREVEDSSDDFFQSKHINKRLDDFEKYKNNIFIKLENGLERIKTAYSKEEWTDNKEKLFLQLFSKLYLDNNFYECNNNYREGYYLIKTSSNIKTCFYDLKSNKFFSNYLSIWYKFPSNFFMKYDSTKLFIENMIKKYFRLHDVSADFRNFVSSVCP